MIGFSVLLVNAAETVAAMGSLLQVKELMNPNYFIHKKF